jgi:hypothetical protein
MASNDLWQKVILVPDLITWPDCYVECLCDCQSVCADISTCDTRNLLEPSLQYARLQRFVLVSSFSARREPGAHGDH